MIGTVLSTLMELAVAVGAIAALLGLWLGVQALSGNSAGPPCGTCASGGATATGDTPVRRHACMACAADVAPPSEPNPETLPPRMGPTPPQQEALRDE